MYLNQYSVFIVDDDEDDRTSIRDAFIANNYSSFDYIFMQSGGQLMDYFATDATTQPSIILLDLNMPGMNGKDVLMEMKKNDALKTIPIVVISTSSSVKDRETSYKLGANCYITKPDSYHELIELMRAVGKLWL